MARAMKLTRPSDIKLLLAELDIQPSRVLGQNFLVDENILRIILDSAHLADTDVVLEIGPGLGVLTEHLVNQAQRVIAIEKDPRLAAYLRERFGGYPSFHLIEGDALDQPLAQMLKHEGVTHLISNLPYSAGTRILVELIDAEQRPLRMVVMLQTDVAERLVAGPGSKTYGVASIHAGMYYDVVLRKTVSPSCFFPPPDVRSAIVEFYRRAEPRVRLQNPVHFNELVKWCFSQRRKQIGRILHDAPRALVPATDAGDAALTAAGVRSDQRPESIAVAAWGNLSNELSGRRREEA
jgi:16S rRNA (adenine1518-N6/adenine1519-N6)-dimethyltransferase